MIRNELPHETYLEMADWYEQVGRTEDALAVLSLGPVNPVALYRMGYLKERIQAGSGKDLIARANELSPDFVFPFRASTAEALQWATTQSDHWKPNYYLALIHWSRNNDEKAKELFKQAGEPDYAPFYASRAELYKDDNYANDLERARTLDIREWRYGKMLAHCAISLLGCCSTHALSKFSPSSARFNFFNAKAEIRSVI